MSPNALKIAKILLRFKVLPNVFLWQWVGNKIFENFTKLSGFRILRWRNYDHIQNMWLKLFVFFAWVELNTFIHITLVVIREWVQEELLSLKSWYCNLLIFQSNCFYTLYRCCIVWTFIIDSLFSKRLCTWSSVYCWKI